MLKKALYSSILMLVVVLFIAYFSFQTLKQEEVAAPTITSQFDDQKLTWTLFNQITYDAYGYTFNEVAQQTVEKIQATDYIHTVDVLQEKQIIGQLIVTLREIDQGDLFVFSKFINTSTTAHTIPLKLTFKEQAQASLFKLQQEIQQEHDHVFGIDHTTNVKGVYSFTNSPIEMMLSQNYISRELVEQYENGQQSVIRELVNEDLFVEQTSVENDTVFNLKLRTTDGAQISENWFLIAQKPLFSSDDEMKYYKNYTNHYFIPSQKWLVHGGNYTKLPWSIEPATKLGYGRNLVQLKDEKLVARYKSTRDRFYYNLIIDNVNNLIDFKGEQDLWLTEYTSAWLKREYGITAPYTDTRHNENIALFLSEVGELLNNEELRDSYLNYANFLATQQQVGNILPTDNGYYILDYYAPNQTKKTHVSLNHALAEMNFLFDAYTLSNNESYYETALNIKAAVEDTSTAWINSTNGDFWYQINGDYSFQDTDYETLTLEDLLKSLAYYKQFDLPIPALYDTLIASKIGFIKATAIEMSDALYKDLMATKYAPLIEGYPHIFTHEEGSVE